MIRYWHEVLGAYAQAFVRWQSGIKMVRRLLRTARSRTKAGFASSDADSLSREVTPLAEAGEWETALSTTLRWADKAERSRDRALLERAGNDLRRLRQFEQSFVLLSQSKHRDSPKEWDGTDPNGKCLVIERRDGDLASFFIFLSTIELGLACGARCIVLVEDRLIPTFRRTFPQADIRSETSERDLALHEADLVTSFEAIARFLRWDGTQRRTLVPDAEETSALRQTYATGPSPLIGIAWGSLNIYKDTPGIDDWRQFFARTSAGFVSLQYGDVDTTLLGFRRGSSVSIVHDRSVDQLIDMDRFASQVASLDGVVTVSNTVAHVAGALGVPTFVLLDGQFKRSWPGFGPDAPWYKKTRLSRRNHSGWNDALGDAEKWLATLTKETGHWRTGSGS